MILAESDVRDIRNSSSCVCWRCRPSSEQQCRSSVAASAVYADSRTGAGGTDGLDSRQE